MKINKPALEQEQQKKSRLSIKTKLILVLLVLELITAATFYWYFTSSQTKLEHSKKLEDTSLLLDQQKTRCTDLIRQQEGNFADFQYCQKLLDVFSN